MPTALDVATMTSFHLTLVSCTKNTIVSLFKLVAWAVAEALEVSFDLHDSGLAPCWCGILNPELLSTMVIYKM